MKSFLGLDFCKMKAKFDFEQNPTNTFSTKKLFKTYPDENFKTNFHIYMKFVLGLDLCKRKAKFNFEQNSKITFSTKIIKKFNI